MKKYVIKPGEKGINALYIQEMTSRQFKPREVCVRVYATSLNYRDLINEIHPVIDRIFKFDQVKEAYEYMQSGQHFGKIVIPLD